MSFEDGLKLVKLRGEAMQEAATSLPRYDWGMSVVLQCSITVCPAGLCLVGVQIQNPIGNPLGILGFSQHLSAFCRIWILSLLSLDLGQGLVARSS